MIIRSLALLLLAQLALTAYLYWPRDGEQAAAERLAENLTVAAVESVTISDGESAVTLERVGDDWRSEDGLPADGGRVATLLGALLAEAPGYAIADSASAARRFRVAADDFERRVDLIAQDRSARVYLGSSPSFRKIHARRDGDDAVFVIALNSYDAPSAAASWLDRGLAALSGVVRMAIDGREYQFEAQRWVATGISADSAEAIEDAVGALLQVLAGLQVTGLATADDAALASAENRVLALTATTESAEAVTLSLFASEDRYFLRSSAFEPLFSISSYDAQQLLDGVAALGGDAASR
jgi:hypothetical protein